MADIVTGTHPDVWGLPGYRTVAVYYPGLTKDQGGMFGSECFYFDYLKQVENLADELRQKVTSDYHIKSDSGKKLFSDIGENVSAQVQSYAPTDRLVTMSLAWVQYLQRNPTYKPQISLVPQFFYDFYNSAVYEDKVNKKVYQLEMPSDASFKKVYAPPQTSFYLNLYESDPTYNPGANQDIVNNPIFGVGTNGVIHGYRNVEEEMNSVHPFSHYPPISGTTLLDDSFFYDPNPKMSGFFFNRMMSQYGTTIGVYVYNYCKNRGSRVKYSDIIKQNGSYGFSIDFSFVGLSQIKFYVPFDLIVRTPNTLNEWSYIGLTINRESQGVKYFRVHHYQWGTTNTISDQFTKRDQWIQSWIAGGKIPIELNQIMFVVNGHVTGMRNRENLNDLYPISIAHNDPDILSAIIEVVFVLASVVYSAATGNIGGLLSTATNILSSVLKSTFPDIAKYVNFGTILLTNSIIYKNFGSPDKEDKTSKTLLGLAGPMMQSMLPTEQSRFDGNLRGVVNIISEEMDDRTKSILAALAEFKEQRLRGYNPSQPKPGGDTTPPLPKKTESDNTMLYAAGLIGAAIVWKKFFKK